MDKRRRKFLASAGAVSLLGLSGCLKASFARAIFRGTREVISGDESDKDNSQATSDNENTRTDGIDNVNNQDNNGGGEDSQDNEIDGIGNQENIDDIGEFTYSHFKVNREVEIEPGGVIYWEIDDLDTSIDQTITLEYNIIVRSGPDINIIFMDDEELEPYLNYENIAYYKGASSRNTKFAVEETEIEPQAYAFVLENPNTTQKANVDVDIKIQGEV